MKAANSIDSRREPIRWVLILLFSALLVMGLYTVMQPFLVPLAWAVILVLTTWPMHRWLTHKLGDRRALSAAIMTLLLALLLIAAVVPLLVRAASEVEAFARELNNWLQNDNLSLPNSIKSIPFIGSWIDNYLLDLKNQRQQFGQLFSDYRDVVLAFATKAAQGIFGALFKIAMCLFATFFLLLHGNSLAEQFSRGFHRVGGERFDRLIEAIRETVRGAVYGVLATAVAQGILAGIGFVAAGAPVPLLLGFATIVASLIPMGTPFVYTPVAIYLLMTGNSWIPGVLLFAWGVGVVSTIDNFLRPLFISQATSMPMLVVFMGVIGGVLSFGLLGIVLGPALLAVAIVLWNEWVEPHPPHHIENTK